MNTAIAPQKTAPTAEIVDDVIARGDLSKLSPEQRVVQYHRVCESLGLNPATVPFQYITLNGKLQLYARKDATDQLRKINGVSLAVLSQVLDRDGLFTVTVRATDKTGRTDEDIGAVALAGLRGEAASNARMKAITKAKRRVTLSICGLGFSDESEVDSIPGAEIVSVEDAHGAKHNPDTGEVLDAADRVRTSGDDYAERWLISLGNYNSAQDLAAEWNSEKPIRDKLTWPDDQAFARLKVAVTQRIEELKQPGLATQRLEAQDS